MLKKVATERARKSSFIVPRGAIDDVMAIERRVATVPEKARSAVKLVLFYLFRSIGPINLKNPQFRVAEPHLFEHEVLLARYLKSRTNGNGRKAYGKAGLMALRKAAYRCEVCDEADVRLLILDHANGREDAEAFFVLCANCHQLKSRLFDWTGKKKG